MPWLQVTLTTDRERAPLIEAALSTVGALSVTLVDAGDEPQLEPPPGATPLWSRVRVTALFDEDAESRSRVELLAATLSGNLAAPPLFEQLKDQPWERAWMDDFAPARFGERLWVCPRGQRPDADNAVVLELDPGLAFGTGHHPTTALCLKWLDRAPLEGATLVDYGCGSGILAIAALKLGARRAVAVDHDPQALEATTANAMDNGVADRLSACRPGDEPRSAADVLVANILAGPLIQLAPTLSRLVRADGRLALSGLLGEQISSVSQVYRNWFDLGQPELQDGWVLLDGLRRAAD